MAESPRPTREQVDGVPHRAAALLLAAARVDPKLRAAAEQVQDALIALDAELERLRARVAELENGPLIYGARVPDGRVLALSESPGHVAEGYTQMQARRGPWTEVSS